MKSISIKLATALLLVAALALGAQKQDQVERQLKAAMNTELVDGNLKAAIEQYKKVRDSGIRPLAAQALIHMAECYRKLGDAESQKVYQQIVNEYADQKDAFALAQARLGGTAAASAKGDHLVWAGFNESHGGPNGISRDGRFITSSGPGMDFIIHDVVTNVDRVLIPQPPDYLQWVEDNRISRDGKQIIYVWHNDGKNGGVGFRIAALQTGRFLEPREFFHASYDDIKYLGPFDWSPDGKWIATRIEYPDRTGKLALIAVTDGTLKVLKSYADEKSTPRDLFFSPDSKSIAYDLPVTDKSPQRNVFVLAIDGSRETPAVVHSANESVMGWSPDGTRLLFSSDRTESVGLWAQPFADGKAQGSPDLVRPDIGPSSSLGVTSSGALYVYKRTSSRDFRIALIDLKAGKLAGPPVGFMQGFLEGAQNPSWSPDGKYLAYHVKCNNGCIAIRSVTTGEVRRLPPTITPIESQNWNWSPDSRSLLVIGRDLKDRAGIFRIDVQSGEAIPVILDDGLGGLAQWSADGKKVYFRRGPAFLERDVASGAEREVNHLGVQGGLLSPDGQYFAVRSRNESEKTTSLLLLPVAGGPSRELLRLTQPEVLGGQGLFGAGVWAWTPDSSTVIISKDTGTRRELWLVPVTGDRPRKLDIDAGLWMEGSGSFAGDRDQGFSLSPDGRSIAFQMGKSSSEIWALENFLPSPSVKK